MTTIAQNLQHIRAQVAQACIAAGRATDDVLLLAVSKTFGPEAVAQAVAAGQQAFGENYIQEGVDKILALRQMGHSQLQWHCIGPVQSNKTRLVAEHFDWVHTIDRLKIAERLSAQRPDHLPPLQVCVQINVDGGPTKSGVPPAEALVLAEIVAKMPRLVVRGLMSMPDPRPDFAAQQAVHGLARQCFDTLVASKLPGLEQVDTLSMGMTGDMAAAVAAGSTIVRVGSGIFGARRVMGAA